MIGGSPGRFAAVERAIEATEGWTGVTVPDAAGAAKAVEEGGVLAVVVDGREARPSGSAPAEARLRVPILTVRTPMFGIPIPGSACGIDPSSTAGDVQSRVTRACDLYEAVAQPAIDEIVGDLRGLPSPPAVYLELLEAARRGAGLAVLADIVQRDPAMTAQVLQLVNSAAFGMSRRVASVLQAVTLVGAEQLRTAVLSAGVFSSFESRQVPGFSVAQFQAYSLRVAKLARAFGRATGVSDDAFSAALLLDIGQLVLAVKRPEALAEVLAQTASTGRAQEDVERDIFGTTHAEVGAHVVTKWGLPFAVAECIAFHHVPTRAASKNVLLGTVHAADALLGIHACGAPRSTLSLDALCALGLDGLVPEWDAMTEAEAARFSA